MAESCLLYFCLGILFNYFDKMCPFVFSLPQYKNKTILFYQDSSLSSSSSFGTFKAIPVLVDELLPDDDSRSTTPKQQKKNFMHSMLKAERISQSSTSIIDQARTHCDKQIPSISAKKSEEAAIAKELQRKQQEIEIILNKKKEEEQLKRLEFEEERIKEENEKLKIAAEEKRKREEQDEIINQEREEWLKREEEKRQLYLSEQNKIKESCVSQEAIFEQEDVDLSEEHHLNDEILLIQLGRKEAQKEYEERR